MMKPNDEKIWGWWYQYKPTTLVVNYGWWAIWTTGYDLLSMHKTHVINLVTTCYRPNSGACKARIGDGLIVTKAVNVRLISNKDIA